MNCRFLQPAAFDSDSICRFLVKGLEISDEELYKYN